MGVFGVGPYAYAAAALLPERELGVMTISTITQAGEHTSVRHAGEPLAYMLQDTNT